jgi:hypothetical protein
MAIRRRPAVRDKAEEYERSREDIRPKAESRTCRKDPAERHLQPASCRRHLSPAFCRRHPESGITPVRILHGGP